MKVKEVIEELKKLDQERHIWVCYDGYGWFAPIPDERVDDWDAKAFADKGVNKDDYVIFAG
jgi:hypothetical protein